METQVRASWDPALDAGTPLEEEFCRFFSVMSHARQDELDVIETAGVEQHHRVADFLELVLDLEVVEVLLSISASEERRKADLSIAAVGHRMNEAQAPPPAKSRTSLISRRRSSG